MNIVTSRKATAGLVAALTAIVSLCVALQGCGPAGGATSGKTAHPTPTFAGFAGPRGQWVTLPNTAGGVPSVVASDPRVAYEIFGMRFGFDVTHAVLRRTDDGGTTWRTLPLPLPGGTLRDYGGLAVIADPVNPDVVFFTVIQPYPPVNACATATAAQAYTGGRTYSGFAACYYDYRSADGGRHWSRITIPSGGQLSPIYSEHISSGWHQIYAQGSRLYSTPQGWQIIASDDSGLTWRTIDDGLRVQHQEVYAYAPTPSGSTVFVVTSHLGGPPFELWRSDDVGANWRHIGRVPLDVMDGMVLMPRRGSADPLIYIAGASRSAPSATGPATVFVVSEDGGATWRQLPSAGLPASDVEPSILGVLNDGSILARSPSPLPSGPTSFTLYAWKDGDAAWRKVAPPLLADGILTVTSAGTGHDAIWAVASFADGGIERWVTE